MLIILILFNEYTLKVFPGCDADNSCVILAAQSNYNKTQNCSPPSLIGPALFRLI